MGFRDIFNRQRGNLNSNGSQMLDFFFVTHRLYDPYSTGLLFSLEEARRHSELSSKTEASASKKFSTSIFYPRRLFQRPSEYNTVLHSSVLF